MLKTFFGEVSEKAKLVSKEQLDNGLMKTVSTVGKLTITCISNKPSQEAIRQMAKAMNRIAEKYVDQQLKKDIA